MAAGGRTKVTIQITKPEVEALIKRRLETGAFKDAEDVILQALRSSESVEIGKWGSTAGGD